VQALLQDPQGYLGGPGFGSGAYEFVRRMLHRYVNTSLSYLIVLVFLVSTIMPVDPVTKLALGNKKRYVVTVVISGTTYIAKVSTRKCIKY
jgi:beta-lactamase regulating signal transducer with metallopeptidase domain